jgi:hypothetical protein
LDSYHRDVNVVGNVLGTSGVHNSYAANNTSKTIYDLGGGNSEGSVTVPPDPLVASTLLRWGNYDTVTAAVRWCGNSSNTGWSTTCSSTSEVPTGLTYYPNPVPSYGDTGAGQSAMPASFYYLSTPSWWPSGKPWPAIGPEVSGGNLGVCSGGSYNLNMANASSQCTGGSLVAAAGGHANSNPAMDCYLNNMGGPPDGTGSMLTFDPNTCYDPTGPAPAPPANLIAVAH